MNAKFCLPFTGRGSGFRRHYAEVNSRPRKRKSLDVEENCAMKESIYNLLKVLSRKADGKEVLEMHTKLQSEGNPYSGVYISIYVK